MDERKCTTELCDSSYCVRAHIIKALFEEEDSFDDTTYEIISFMEKILEDEKCQRPKELKAAIEELKNKFIF